MFKRVEKRRRKREEEEELGLDEDMKEILGMHDTDSEESASASESDTSSGEGDDKEDEVDADMGVEEELSSEDDDDEDETEEDPEVTVSQALKDSIYVVSVMPEVRACIVCPGKLLKGVKMVELHRTSNAHERRLKQFKTIAAEADPNESAWEILKQRAEKKPKLSLEPSTSGISKRAEKKKARQAYLKLRREMSKEKKVKKATKALPTSAQETVAESSSSTVNGPSRAEFSSVKLKGKKKATSEASDPTPVSAPVKKKRKLKITNGRKESSVVALPSSKTKEPQKSSVVEGSSHPKKRIKSKKTEDEASGTTRATPTDDGRKTLLSVKSKERVRDIVRSTATRAKNARSRAMSASKGTKGETSQKVVAVS